MDGGRVGDMRDRVLIVDDEPEVQESLSRCLEGSGYHVMACGSLSEAASAVKAFSPHLVLLDLHLDREEGLDLLRGMGDNSCGIPPVVVLSEEGSWESAVEAMRLGCRDYLVKPVEEGELLFRVSEVIRRGAFRYKMGRVLPICCVCGKVKSENGEWMDPSSYLVHDLGMLLSHTYCPECFEVEMGRLSRTHEKHCHLPDEGGDELEPSKE